LRHRFSQINNDKAYVCKMFNYFWFKEITDFDQSLSDIEALERLDRKAWGFNPRLNGPNNSTLNGCKEW